MLPALSAQDVFRRQLKARLEEIGKKPADLARAVNRSPAWASAVINGRRNVPMKLIDPIAELVEWPRERLFVESDEVSIVEHGVDDKHAVQIAAGVRSSLERKSNRATDVRVRLAARIDPGADGGHSQEGDDDVSDKRATAIGDIRALVGRIGNVTALEGWATSVRAEFNRERDEAEKKGA